MARSRTLTSAANKKKSTRKSPAKRAVKKTPRTQKPEGMTLEQWQIALRREFGREQDFKLKKLGEAPIFSDFEVLNPASGRAYRVAIRGAEPGESFCSCPDFATNALGTCKHIEFTLGKLERKRGGKKALREGFHPPYSSVYLRYGAQREVHFRAGTECPTELRAHAMAYFDERGVLRPDAVLRFDEFLREAPRNGHELRCYKDVLAFVARQRDDQHRREAIDKTFAKGADSGAFKKLLKVELYPYQREGALFAARAGRCLLADDMGLGKTIQAIAAAEILEKTAGIERVLVVCPTAVKHQWKREIERFTHGRNVEVVEGLLARRQAGYRSDTFYKIVSYDVIHRDMKLIEAWGPDLVVLDEAQRIKNWATRRARSVKQLAAPYAIVLTGTPIENRLEELYSIMQFVDTFRLGPLFRFLHKHQETDEGGKVVGYRDLSHISETLAPVLLRRTKENILQQLPERIDTHYFFPMTPQQSEHHEDNDYVVRKIVSKWRKLKYISEGDQRRLMIALQNMRMSCNSTFLLDKETDHGVKADELVNVLESYFEEPETKAVVFSQWVRTHHVVLPRLERLGCGHAFYHGSLDQRAREKALLAFREDPNCRILLATDAGGVGLNLQHANVLVNMDQPWNPAVLEQRIGRIHRLGQHRPVRILHFVSKGTIEEQMLGVIKFKKSVFAGVLDGGENDVFLGGSRLKKFMETVEHVTEVMPEAMPDEEPEAKAGAETAPADEEAAESMPAAAAQTAPDWGALLTQGAAFLGQLSQTLAQPAPKRAGKDQKQAATPLADLIETDPKSGRTTLKLPVPEPETLNTIAAALQNLAAALGKR